MIFSYVLTSDKNSGNSRIFFTGGEPRRLLKVLPDIEFIELKDSDRCCGGMLGTVNRDFSNTLSQKKAEAIVEANVDAAATECPFCKDMISKALEREKKRIPVSMMAELIEVLYEEELPSLPLQK
jgi:Fe-S oxidoreductase